MATNILQLKLNKILIGLAVLSAQGTWAACTNLEYQAGYYTGPARATFSSVGFTGVGPGSALSGGGRTLACNSSTAAGHLGSIWI